LKYISVFMVTAIIFLFAGLLVYLQLNNAEKNADAMKEYSTQVNNMSQLASTIQAKDVQIADFLLAETDTYIETFDDYETELTALIEEIELHLKTDEEIQLMNELKNNDSSIN